MALLRWIALPVIVGTIMVGFSFVNGPEEGLVAKLAHAQQQISDRAMQGRGSDAASRLQLPPPMNVVAPSDTPSASATATDTPASSPIATDTDTATSTPTATASPTDTPTLGTPSPTATPSSQTGTPTPTGIPDLTPSATTTPDVTLPVLIDAPDDVGTVALGTVGALGGRISTADGRAVVDFPAGATDQNLAITITRKTKNTSVRPGGDLPIAAAWQFDAASAATGVAVHQFAQDLTFTIRFGTTELGDLDPATLQFWSSQDGGQTWGVLHSDVDATRQTMIVHANHFSQGDATADRLVNNGALLDGHNTNLHAGSAAFAIPINMPAGRNGLTPDLKLSYDSGRVAEMKQYTDLSSWTGVGWEMSTGSIQISHTTDQPDGVDRLFLDMGNYGGEMFPNAAVQSDTKTGTYYQGGWSVGDDQYVKIDHNCGNLDCPFVLTDKHGTQYTFGGSDPFRRWECSGWAQSHNPAVNPPTTCGVASGAGPSGGCGYNSSGCTPRRYYRLDLASIQDVLGNRIDYTYAQQQHTACDIANTCATDYIISAYPSKILYNGGRTKVTFGLENDGTTGYGYCGPLGCDYYHDKRVDAPADFTYCSEQYVAPKIQETDRLNNIVVQTQDSAGVFRNVRRYTFAYDKTASSSNPVCSGIGSPAPWEKAGNSKLRSLDVWDNSDVTATPGPQSLQHMTFGYGSADLVFSFSGFSLYQPTSYSKPFLQDVTNGFGGSVHFDYAAKQKAQWAYGDPLDRWTREVVVKETNDPGLGEPPIVTNYSYGADGSGPDYYLYPDPYDPLQAADLRGASYRGFQTVVETDAGGNATTHNYFTTDVGGGWWDELRTGREFNTTTRDAAGTIWQSVSSEWVVRPVGSTLGNLRTCTTTQWQTCTVPPFNGPTATPTVTPTATAVPAPSQQGTLYAVNFVYARSKTTTLKDGKQTKTVYSYDGPDAGAIPTPCASACYGLLAKVDDLGDPGDQTHNAEVITNTAYTLNTTKWLFLPSYVEKVDPGGNLLSCERDYYDGNTSLATAPTPSLGLLTAKSSAVDRTITQATCEGGLQFPDATAVPAQSTNTYFVYETYNTNPVVVTGNVYKVSNPTDKTPVTTTSCPTNTSCPYGWIPSGVQASSTTYDTTYHVFPVTKTNPKNQSATYDYNDPGRCGYPSHGNFVLGKPMKVTEPNGHATNYGYDNFGRLACVYDNGNGNVDPNAQGLDTETSPTMRFTYAWGANGPNSTLAETKANNGTGGGATYTKSVSCMDGFGRELQHSANYNGLASNTNAVRTDYDVRGNKAVVTNAYDNNYVIACPSAGTSFATTSDKDRTAYQYDALGNVFSTTSIAGSSQITGRPHTSFIYNGTTIASVDELYRRTLQTKDLTLRTLSVTEPLQSIVVRPNGQDAVSTNWVGSPDPSVSHYQYLNESTSDDDARQISISGAVGKDVQSYPNAQVPTNSTISSVIFHFRWKESDTTETTGNGVQPLFRQSDGNGHIVEADGPIYHRANADGWVDETWETTANPRTNAAWTYQDFNSGSTFGLQNLNANTHAYVTQTWIELVVQDPATARTKYTYDRLGRLTDVSDASTTSTHNVTHMDYDLAGHKTRMSDPDMGAWDYVYDAAGNLKTQMDARSDVSGRTTTTLGYDALQRVVSKQYALGGAAPTNNVNYTYDTYYDTSLCPQGNAKIGHMTLMVDGGTDGEYRCYDLRGQLVTSRRIVDATNYDTRTTYDPLGQPATVTYPGDNEVVTYGKNDQGALTGVTAASTTLLANAKTTPWGAPSTLSLGSSGASVLTSNIRYDSRERAYQFETQTQNFTDIQKETLTFDDASNVTANVDAVAGETSTYNYDQLDRVTAMWVNGAQISAYTYNQIGDMTYKAEAGNGNYFLYYPATGQARPHGTSYAWNIGVAYTFTAYDANGNMTAETGPSNNAFNYDVENRLVSRTLDGGGTMAYSYDGNGQMLKRTNSADSSSTVYVGGIYEKKTVGGSVTTTKYYRAFGRTIAMRTVTSSTNDVTYILSDHLGSTTQTVTGGVVATQKYYPYGATRGTPVALPTDKLFTGQQQESGDSLGLYNYKARFYSTTLGRFLSVDPVGGRLDKPQSWNAYTYAYNNPLKHTDPSGKCITGSDGPRGCGLDPVSGPPPNPAGDNQAALDWVNQTAVNGDRISCPECDALSALASAGLVSPSLVQDAQAAVWASTVAQGAGPTADAATSDGGGGGFGWGSVLGVGGAVVATTMSVTMDAAPTLSLSVPAAAFPVALGVATVFLAPCDTAGCTSTDYAARTSAKGPPNSTRVFPRENGGVTVREYGPDGRATKDIDYGHPEHNPETQEPHVHDWDWRNKVPRGPDRDPYPGEVPPYR